MFIAKKTSDDVDRFVLLDESSRILESKFLQLVNTNANFLRRSDAPHHKFTFEYYEASNNETELFTLKLVPIGVL